MTKILVELLPCPFCGGEAKDRHRENSNVVTCSGCGVQVKQSEVGYGDAADRWNRRAQPAQTGDEPIQRYSFDQTGCDEHDPFGEWVSYEDHLAAMEAAQSRTQEQFEMLRSQANALHKLAYQFGMTAGTDVTKLPNAMARTVADATLYRTLRAMHWSESPFCVVANPREAVRLGSHCPSDDELDKALTEYLEKSS